MSILNPSAILAMITAQASGVDNPALILSADIYNLLRDYLGNLPPLSDAKEFDAAIIGGAELALVFEGMTGWLVGSASAISGFGRAVIAGQSAIEQMEAAGLQAMKNAGKMPMA